jgi:RNA polymerase sigma-70 factor, ECF subfamily
LADRLSFDSAIAFPVVRLLAAVTSAQSACARPLTLYHPVEMPTDEQLFSAMRGGDEGSLETLINRYGARLFAYLLRITRSRETAEDLFQETWITVVRRCDRFGSGRRVKPWLYRVALNVARDHLRRERASRRGGATQLLPLEDATEAQLACSTTITSETMAVHEAVERLPEKFRSVVVLHYFEGLTIDEIKHVIRRPAGTVKSRLSRGLKILQETLGKA